MTRLRRWSVRSFCIVFAATALGYLAEQNRSAAADEPKKNAEESKWAVDRSLTLTPRAESMPAFKYRLYPLASELKEGNAVPIYLRLAHEQSDASRKAWRDKPAEWNQLPLDKLPIQEAKEFLESHASVQLQQLMLGARRRTAEWNYTLDTGDPIGLLLPDAQMMRTYGGLLILQARLAIAEGDYVRAANILQTGFRLSRQVSEAPFLICGLVGNAIASQLADVVLDWISRSDSPNLYWALTALPRPLLDSRTEYEFEYRMMELQFPDLADLTRERAPAEWDAALRRVRTEFQRIQGLVTEGSEGKLKPIPGSSASDPADRSHELPEARKFLIEHLQMPAARVQDMPAAQLLLLYIGGVMDEYRDDMYKGTYLSLNRGLPVATAADARFRKSKVLAETSEAARIPAYFMSAIPKVILNLSRLERRIAALRVIEAARLHAAAHDGQFPEKLADITEVPVPNDPGTGQPFEYRRENETATLVAPALNDAPHSGLRIHLNFKAKP
jgi:hypothetical protein